MHLEETLQLDAGALHTQIWNPAGLRSRVADQRLATVVAMPRSFTFHLASIKSVIVIIKQI